MGKEQVLTLTPSDSLRFKGPFIDDVVSELHIENPSKEKVAFKVKTTAPKRYCVRPNSGILDPAGKGTLQFILMPLEFDPTKEHRDKFMVQTVIVPDGTTDTEALWKTVATEAIMDTKLCCIFELPNETMQQAAAMEHSGVPPTALLETSAFRDDGFVQASETEELWRAVAQLKRELDTVKFPTGGTGIANLESDDIVQSSFLVRRLRKATPHLVQGLDCHSVYCLVDALLAARDGRGLITDDHRQEIEAESTDSGKVRKLLRIVASRGDEAIQTLARSLMCEGVQRPDLAELILEPPAMQ